MRSVWLVPPFHGKFPLLNRRWHNIISSSHLFLWNFIGRVWVCYAATPATKLTSRFTHWWPLFPFSFSVSNSHNNRVFARTFHITKFRWNSHWFFVYERMGMRVSPPLAPGRPSPALPRCARVLLQYMTCVSVCFRCQMWNEQRMAWYAHITCAPTTNSTHYNFDCNIFVPVVVVVAIDVSHIVVVHSHIVVAFVTGGAQ